MSINPTKHTVRIVGHSEYLEDAIDLVKQKADEYVKYKNGPVMHRGADSQEVTFTDRVLYFTQNCPDHAYQIDVFRQQTQKIKGWTGSSYRDHSKLVRRFSYAEYDGLEYIESDNVVENEEIAKPDEDIEKLRKERAEKLGLTHMNTHGGFPPTVLQSLQQSEMFIQSRESADRNRLPESSHTHIVFDSSSGETEDEN